MPLARGSKRYTGQLAPRYSQLHNDPDLLWVVPFRVRYIVGVCGLRYSGKSAVMSHLVERKRFKHYSLANTLRRLAAEQGISESDRKALQDFGDEIRRKHNDQAYLARLTLREIRRDHLSHTPEARFPARIVVGGFKRPEEIQTFRAISQFALIGLVIHDDSKRLERANRAGIPSFELGRQPGDISEEEFAEQLDKRDRRGYEDDEYGQALDQVMAEVKPEERLVNQGTIGDLYRAVNERISEFDLTYRVPRG